MGVICTDSFFYYQHADLFVPNDIEKRVFEKTKDEMLTKGLSKEEVEKIMALIITGDKGLSSGINEILGANDEDR